MAAAVFFVCPVSPRDHLFEVRCVVAQPHADGQVFRLPSWIRGSYLVRDFAKHVVDLRAECNGEAVPVVRVDKRTLRCAPVSGPLELHYRVYAFDNSVRKAYLDLKRGFYNGSSLFYAPDDRRDEAYEMVVERPRDPSCDHWRVATSMSAVDVDADGYGRYRAENYEELIDHPVELGGFECLEFEVGGIPHTLVLAGRYTLDRERAVDDLRRICTVERAMFGNEPELDRYLFLTNVVGKGYGGLEHRSSTALICSRRDLPQGGTEGRTRNYLGFLSLCSHEYFHLWNVKRITPQALHESDLGAEAYTRDLWHYEGITSYYDDFFLLRAGIVEAADYLDLLAINATRAERMPGAAVQALADSSFEAWTKYYQPDESTPNITVSYYTKGAMAALCLDLTLRLHSDVTLDDVMHAAWRRWGKTGRPVPEGGLEALAQELSELDLTAFFDHVLRSTRPLPLAELLGAFGVTANCRPAHGASDEGGRSQGQPPGVDLGLRLRPGTATVAVVYEAGPAQVAGLHAGDQIVAVDGLRVTSAGWEATLAGLSAGATVPVHVFRDEELLELRVTPRAPVANTWVFGLDPRASAQVKARRQAWLGA